MSHSLQEIIFSGRCLPELKRIQDLFPSCIFHGIFHSRMSNKLLKLTFRLNLIVLIRFDSKKQIILKLITQAL